MSAEAQRELQTPNGQLKDIREVRPGDIVNAMQNGDMLLTVEMTDHGRLKALDTLFAKMGDGREKRAALAWLKQRHDP